MVYKPYKLLKKAFKKKVNGIVDEWQQQLEVLIEEARLFPGKNNDHFCYVRNKIDLHRFAKFAILNSHRIAQFAILNLQRFAFKITKNIFRESKLYLQY